MAFRGGGQQKVQKLMVQPINLIFRFLQNRSRIQMWLFDQKNLRIEGHVIGFDEYMNLVLDDAEEVHIKRGERKSVGRILIKGDNITLIQNVSPQASWGTDCAAKMVAHNLVLPWNVLDSSSALLTARCDFNLGLLYWWYWLSQTYFIEPNFHVRSNFNNYLFLLF